MSDPRALSDAAIQQQIDALLVRATEVSPPCTLIEAHLQAQLLARLGSLRDEQFRRDLATRTPSPQHRRRAGGRRAAA